MAKTRFSLQRIRARIQAVLDESMFWSPDRPSRVYRFIHFWMLVGRSFVRNRCPIRASALSFTTLLALIPMLAVAISVTGSLLKKEGEDQIYRFIDQIVSSLVPPAPLTNAPAFTAHPPGASANINPPPPAPLTDLAPTHLLAGADTNAAAPASIPAATTNAPVLAIADHERIESAQKQAARYIHEFIQNIRGGTLGVAGMVLLVFVAIRLLSSIEATFNDIWGVTRGRKWLTSIVLYWTTITLGPLLLTGALALAGSSHFAAIERSLRPGSFIGGIIMSVLPLFALWIVFALFYLAVPNTKVRFGAALVGAIVGGTAWHVNNYFGFLYVSRVVSNSKIYGSLFLVPVFMAGIYLSWLILLFGAQVAYAFQNRKLYQQEKLAENVNQRGREFVALRLMTCLGQRFQRGLPPPTVEVMSGELGIPSRLVQQVLQTLLAARLVMEISGAEPAYSPARPLDSINAHHVLMAMRATLGQELVTREEPVREEVYGEFARIQEAEKQVASAVTMLALVNRAQTRLELPAAKGVAVVEEEFKLKPALVPAVESVAAPPQKAGAGQVPHSPAVHSPDFSDPGQGNQRQGNEWQGNVGPADTAKPGAAAPPVASEQAKATQPGQKIAEPVSDAEREFPL